MSEQSQYKYDLDEFKLDETKLNVEIKSLEKKLDQPFTDTDGQKVTLQENKKKINELTESMNQVRV